MAKRQFTLVDAVASAELEQVYRAWLEATAPIKRVSEVLTEARARIRAFGHMRTVVGAVWQDQSLDQRRPLQVGRKRYLREASGQWYEEASSIPQRLRVESGWHYLLPISLGPLMIIRLPLPPPPWKIVLKAMTGVMHSYGLRKKDLSTIDFLASDGFLPEDSAEAEANADWLARLVWAYAGDPSLLPNFDLWTWRSGEFVIIRRAKRALETGRLE